MTHRFMRGPKWVKDGEVVDCTVGEFTLNGEPVGVERIYELLQITPRQVEVSEAIAPHPLYARYGRAFLEGVEWTDSLRDSDKNGKPKSKNRPEKISCLDMLVRAEFEKQGWTIRHKFMVGNEFTNGNDSITGYYGNLKLNGKEVGIYDICDFLHIDERLVLMFVSLRSEQLLGRKYSVAFLDGVEWADASIAAEIRQIVKCGGKFFARQEDARYATFQPLFENMNDILQHPERYDEKITHISAGGFGACAFSRDLTVAELVQCWQHEEYQTECPVCGEKAYVTHWAGKVNDGGFWVISLCCPKCKREHTYHQTCYKYHWSEMRRVYESCAAKQEDPSKN